MNVKGKTADVNDSNQGFSLIELLVVIVVIGVLTGVSLPSFLSQASKASQTEAKSHINNIIRAQQVRYAEKGNFATEIDALALGGIRGASTYSTAKYTYQMATSNPPFTTITAEAKDNSLKSYSGALAIRNPNSQESFWETVMCGTDLPGPVTNASTDAVTCPTGYYRVTAQNP
jgi:type IV pilus assembly protein PilA